MLNKVAFSPDGRRLASAGSDGNICLRTLDDPDQTVTLMGHDDQLMTVAFSPDGKTLASGSADGTVRLWNATSNSQPQSLYYVDNWVYHVAFSPDSKYAAVLSAANSRALTLWDAAADREIGTADFPTTDPGQVSFSPDSKAVCASSHGQTSFYRVPRCSGSLMRWPTGSFSPTTSVSLSYYGTETSRGVTWLRAEKPF
jgi:WD40 repeat protein